MFVIYTFWGYVMGEKEFIQNIIKIKKDNKEDYLKILNMIKKLRQIS